MKNLNKKEKLILAGALVRVIDKNELQIDVDVDRLFNEMFDEIASEHGGSEKMTEKQMIENVEQTIAEIFMQAAEEYIKPVKGVH
ncbi:hypothetical protein COM97_27245 [Bacillus thuringiensis]|uniref:hypothetical protein n=1 Tax=Bacillus thuringiensis TaxID=1428 RepID=UPI000BED40EB|nr:hypothetical protein [Bacillus thuringiensis]PEF03438.1 hypothetical protein COM97_27245 [Bacillus thuringiensis]